MKSELVQVVVVDDVKDSVDTMAILLRLYGYAVRTADTAEEALNLIEQDPPHCVLFDVVMPGMGGDELCRRLRDRYGDDIVLIAVSACSVDDERVATSFTLADHFLTKPIDPAALASVLAPLT
ncbi:response regulator [Variovorax sp. J22R133]|uniref:response regulator n=1 Tax=Variovorax brevis TaxID=3053503 RepID=UPI002577DEAE|nr:response regulator [Variovorax sp. J22R133]MDM0118087.1 response regulator [Variovorax sp. J22R133]